jgi:hypothetical protein
VANQDCIKDTGFYCACHRCMAAVESYGAKSNAAYVARKAKVSQQIASYWVSDFTPVERDLALSVYSAGYDIPSKRCATCGNKFKPGNGERADYCKKCC